MSKWRPQARPPLFLSLPAGGERSVAGRARTLALAAQRPGSSASEFRLPGLSAGYYTAYRHMAEEELAFVFHYGDYIYEYGPDTPRRPAAFEPADFSRSTTIGGATPSTRRTRTYSALTPPTPSS